MGKSGDKVSKGFGFYFLMLILILVASFLIIVTIMLFSPGSTILGYKYFGYNEKYSLSATTDTQVDFNFASTTKITINCKYANVYVTKNKSIIKDNVTIENYAKGFAKGGQNTDFIYSVSYTGTELNIDISEPEGFLYFDSGVSIIVQVPLENAYVFANTSFDITTTDGNVYIGRSGIDSEKPDANINLDINSLSVSTGNGNIVLREYNEPTFNHLFISTGRGSFNSLLENTYVKNQSKITSTNGTIRFKNFIFKNGVQNDSSKFLDLNIGDSYFYTKKMIGSIALISRNAEVFIQEMTGDFAANETRDTINRTKITIQLIVGDISLPYAKASNIYVGKAVGQMNIETTSGNVTIGENGGISQASWILTETGNIQATVADETVCKHYFTTTSGKIDLKYTKTITSENYIESKNGNVDMKIGSSYQFLLTLRNKDGVAFDKMTDKVNMSFINAEQFKNPFQVNGYTGSSNLIDISTNGYITVGLV